MCSLFEVRKLAALRRVLLFLLFSEFLISDLGSFLFDSLLKFKSKTNYFNAVFNAHSERCTRLKVITI